MLDDLIQALQFARDMGIDTPASLASLEGGS